MPPPPQPPLSIVCFGASLVEGYTESGARFTPYASWLTAALQHRYPARELAVETDGVSGEMVTETFEWRMRALCKFGCAVFSSSGGLLWRVSLK
jgi:hypothetical protein